VDAPSLDNVALQLVALAARLELAVAIYQHECRVRELRRARKIHHY
jgi:hypothetical protein